MHGDGDARRDEEHEDERAEDLMREERERANLAFDP
jgi:hypothetical protein